MSNENRGKIVAKKKGLKETKKKEGKKHMREREERGREGRMER